MKIGLLDVDGHNFPNLALRYSTNMIAYIYTKKPYLQRRGDFDIYFKNGEGKDIHLTIIPK
jgi:hypothetical protein